MTEEIWKPVVGFEGRYEVSDQGRVRSIGRWTVLKGNGGSYYKRFRKGVVLTPQKHTCGYACLRIGCASKTIHRLVAKAFVPNPEGKLFVNHKNGDKKDNRACNLEWVTCQENADHAGILGLRPSGESNGMAILSAAEVSEIRDMLASKKYLQREIGGVFGVSQQQISKIALGLRWQNGRRN